MKERKKKLTNVPNLRFPNFEGEWRVYKISDLLEFFSTNSLTWEQLEYKSGNLQNVHYGLIHNGLPTQVRLNTCTLPYVKKESIPNNYIVCKEGDIAFADASENTNDVAKVIEFLHCDNKNVICGLHTIHGRDKLNLTVSGFKGYAFSSTTFRHQIRRLAQGSKVYSISQKNLNDCVIGIPSLREQKKIAHLIQLTDERISTQIKIIEELKLLKVTLRNKIYKQIIKTSQDRQISELLDYEQPTKYIVANTEYLDNKLLTPVLTANKAFILGYTNENFGIYNKEDCIILDDFTMDLKYVNFPFKVKSSAIKILTAKRNINLKFIYEYLSFLRLTSGEHKRHYISEIEPMYISIPKIEIQSQMANILSILDEKICIEISQYELFIMQKQYLLRHLFI